MAQRYEDVKCFVWTQIHWIRSETLNASARLNNGDITGVERALRNIEAAIAGIRKEMEG